MAQITKEITVDVARKNLFQAIVAKQYDENSRFLKVTICNEGVKINVPTTATVVINAERADETAGAYMGEVNEDGTVTVPLTSWMLGLDDMVRCSISIIDAEEQKLTSTTFTIDVERAEVSNEDITEDENYDVLVRLISTVSDLEVACENATSAAQTATTNADNATAAANNAAETATAAAAEAQDISDYYGSPLMASTVAGMTQTNRIYVYTGSETGYTAGNWYYYDGSAWVSGGVYNSSVNDGFIITDTDNNKTYKMQLRIIGGKPVGIYDEI